ncbi:PAS domain S-box protein [Alteromonas sp. ASW11-19]|uniref:histidine kinase n=1 Tax=Alteromonas salexigens TaxID=2982530 RepID=A0ABT2VQ01_9ALTE|nr:PAS domain-containing sensor histidine kinase [Alteromonas salexigens]MCU7555394.1 PAS domain S-box protein [Alteromonas salexigens]
MTVWFASALIICVVVFLIDSITPLGMAAGYLYIPSLILCSFSRNVTQLRTTFLIILLFFISGTLASYMLHEIMLEWFWALNRLLSSTMLTLIFFGLYRVIKKVNRLEEEKQVIDKVIDAAGIDVILLDLKREVVDLLGGGGAMSLFNIKTRLCLEDYLASLGTKNQARMHELLKSIGGRSGFEYESDFLDVTPHEHWYRIKGFQVSTGKYHCIVQNISLKSDEGETTNNLNAILDLLPCFAWTAKPSGEIDHVNQRLIESTQYSKEDLVNQWADYVHEEDKDKLLNDWAYALKVKEKLSYEARFRRKDGTLIHSVNEISPIFNDKQHLIKWFGFGLDISDLHRLQQRTTLLNRIIEETHNAAMFCEFDEKKAVLTAKYFNKACEKLTGFSETEIVGKNPIKILNMKERTSLESPFSQVHINGRDLLSGEVHVKTKKGNEIIVDVYSLSLDDDTHSDSYSVIIIMQDKTTEKRLEAITHRNSRMDSIGHLTGGIAHDFNNLLAVISGNLELIKLEAISERVLSLTDNAQSAAQQGASLTRSLLQFARGSENQTTDFTPVSETLAAQLALFTSVNSEQQIDIADDIQPNLNAVIPHSQLESIVINLLNNAKDALFDTLRPHIKVQASLVLIDKYEAESLAIEPGDYVKIVFSDNGCGMSGDQLENIFSPFYTTKNKSKGTGLGLSLVFAYVRQSGGIIDVKSEIGKGTTFILYLRKARINRREPLDKDHSLGGGFYPDSVALIIEDKPKVAEVAKRHLESFGFNCRTYGSGAHVLDAITPSSKVDLIFTDISLPGELDGFDVAREIVKCVGEKPVIYVSGYFEEVSDDALIAGAVKLEKPYTRLELARALESVM